MKNRFFTLCVILITRLSAVEITFEEEDWDRLTFLVSYGSSGNTWLRYCLEFLTKRPTTRLVEIKKSVTLDTKTKGMKTPINNTYEMGVNYKNPPILKVHNFLENYPIEKFSKKTQSKYILLIRNPKECLKRQNTLSLLNETDFHFYQNIEVYDRWNPKTRKLIYYEDLILQPREVLSDLLEFLEADDRYLDPFMNDFAFHQNRSLNFFEETNHESFTKGAALTYHSSQLTLKKKREIDRTIKNIKPLLWERYLKRYAEDAAAVSRPS